MMKNKLDIFKQSNLKIGPQIEFTVSCHGCEYLDYEYKYEESYDKEKAICLKNNKIIYDSNEGFQCYEHETPDWCPLTDVKKLKVIADLINEIEIRDEN